jgi:hypothetical protein
MRNNLFSLRSITESERGDPVTRQCSVRTFMKLVVPFSAERVVVSAPTMVFLGGVAF